MGYILKNSCINRQMTLLSFGKGFYVSLRLARVRSGIIVIIISYLCLQQQSPNVLYISEIMRKQAKLHSELLYITL